MNKNPLMMILGISLLVGVLTAVIFQETKYYHMSTESKEITHEFYLSLKDPSCETIDGRSCAELLSEKRFFNY